MAIGTKKIENYVPVVRLNQGIYSAYDIQTTSNLVVGGNLTVSGDISLSDDITVDSLTATNTITVDSNSASALTVGNNGATNPVLQVDASTASQATGVKVTGAAAASGVAVAVISSGTNENLTLDAKGSGTVTINGTGTGNIVLGRASTGVSMSLTGGDVLKSATAIPATAGAVAAGVPVSMYSTGITVEVTSDPPTHTRPKGSICINTGGSSTSTRMYVNTDGAGTWASFTTSA
jgi:hypothetical protein